MPGLDTNKDKYCLLFWSSALKRVFDILVSVIGLFCVWWIILLGYFIARIDTGESGFFTQLRVGRDQKPFKVIKLRTMKAHSTNTSSVTIENDVRISTSGRFFRQTKVDELPQLFNVLIGNMSMVGPRPTVESDYALMNNIQKKRANILPGITGLAQINGNTSLPWPTRIEFDLEYIARQNIWLDIKIILDTFILIFTGKSETHPPGEKEW